MKTMFVEAGIPGYYTIHLGKRRIATTLYQAGVPEEEIMEKTGHRSVESVKKLKRPSTEMLKDILDLLERQLENVKKAAAKESQNREKPAVLSPTYLLTLPHCSGDSRKTADNLRYPASNRTGDIFFLQSYLSSYPPPPF